MNSTPLKNLQKHIKHTYNLKKMNKIENKQEFTDAEYLEKIKEAEAEL